jgi:peptidoglycan/LPS O-acetylase OafA/YrhL
VNAVWASLREPRSSVTAMLLAAVAAGFVLLLVAYLRTSDTDLVPFQLPFLVSAGAVGLALVGAASALISIHLDRVEAAEERRQLAELRRQLRGAR